MEYIDPFNLGNPGEFTMLELAEVRGNGRKRVQRALNHCAWSPLAINQSCFGQQKKRSILNCADRWTGSFKTR
jgi:hypothetical protein